MSGYREGTPQEVVRSERLVESILQAMSDEAERICVEDEEDALAVDVALSALVCVMKSMARCKLSPQGCKNFWNNIGQVAVEEYAVAVANAEFLGSGQSGRA